jgi:hypothetical protein
MSLRGANDNERRSNLLAPRVYSHIFEIAALPLRDSSQHSPALAPGASVRLRAVQV